MQILRSNKWQAPRYGLEGLYIDPFFGRKSTMPEAAVNLYRHVKPVSETLKSTAYLDEIPEILKRRLRRQQEGREFSDNIIITLFRYSIPLKY